MPREPPVTSEVGIASPYGALIGRIAAASLVGMRRLAIAAALVAVAVAVLAAAAMPAQSATVRVQRFSSFQDVTAAGTHTKYRLRLAYVVPGTWRRRGRAKGLTRTFGPVGSCGFTVRVSTRAVTGPSETATARVARIQPASAGTVLDSGNRRDFAWSVLRLRGTDTVSGLLERPAPSVRTQPAGGQLWLEVRFTATADPRRECHSGGPRTVGAQTGDALATTVVGGFEL
jgi:hypothetical protein